MPKLMEEKIPGLEGIRGRIRLETDARSVLILRIKDGEVDVIPGEGSADTIVLMEDEADIPRILSGEINPLTSAMQGRAAVKGDKALAIKTFLGLRAGSPFSGQRKLLEEVLL